MLYNNTVAFSHKLQSNDQYLTSISLRVRRRVARPGDHRVCDGALWRTRSLGLECPDLPAVAIGGALLAPCSGVPTLHHYYRLKIPVRIIISSDYNW